MNFDFKKPEISLKQLLTLILALVLCAGQLSIPTAVIAKDLRATVSGDASGDSSGNSSGDASGDSSGDASGDAECHELEVVGQKAATCTEEGYTGDIVCIKCNKTIEKGSTIPKVAHQTETKNQKAATCTKEGYTGDTVCKVCNQTIQKGKATKKIPHNYGSWKTTKSATVLKEGTQERTCTVCKNKDTKKIKKIKATISVNHKSIVLAVKQSTTAVKVTYGKGDGIKSWKSSNTKIATVSSKGKITGKKAGTAKITVTLKSGKKATITIKVQKKAVATSKITVNSKKVTLKKGGKFQIKTTVSPTTSKQKVTYTSNDKKVATVSSSGKITAKKKGTATITVKSGSKSVKVKVTVK